jgi:hypothetical protein
VLAKNTDRMIGPRRPVADPGRALRVEGDLDTMVAAGLGLDISALRERAESVGVLPTLQQTPVPLAMQPGESPADKLLLPALREALQAELKRTLSVAAPPAVAPRSAPAAPGTQPSRAAPVRDALDALIDGVPAEDEEEGGS